MRSASSLCNNGPSYDCGQYTVPALHETGLAGAEDVLACPRELDGTGS